MALPRSLPNQLTILRIVLAAVLFVILHLVGWAQGKVGATDVPELARSILARESLLLNLGAAIFLLAAISDILDGQIARRWNLTTDFGRIADPFADKVIVSGAFTFLIPIAGSGVSAWMVVVIVARESLVDGLRGFAESRGIPFPSSWWGKTKMFSQSTVIILMLLLLANAPAEDWRTKVIWGLMAWVIFVTLYSGLLYVIKARGILRAGAENAATTASRPSEPVQGAR